LSVSKAVNYAISHGYQIAPNALKLLQQVANSNNTEDSENITLESILQLVIEEKVRAQIENANPNSINTITIDNLVSVKPDLFDEHRVEHPSSLVDGLETQHEMTLPEKIESNIQVVSDTSSTIVSTGCESFAELFRSRYEKLLKILKERPESRQLSRISELDRKKHVHIAGLVYSKKSRKNGIELTIDDQSGKLSVFVLNGEIEKSVNEVALDQCVMLELEGKGERFFLKNIIQPDIPNRISSYSKKTVYALFLSDLHIGSKKFLEGSFQRLLQWLAGEGFQARQDEGIIKRLKYVIIAGDIVDGVGIFPSQEEELVETNVYKQYSMASRELALIPRHLSLFVIPGNHDSTRQALPQPTIPRKYAQGVYDLENILMLGNPALIKLHGVLILMYHGRSLDDVLATTPGLSYERPADAMKVLLRARHLAPSFGLRTPIAPQSEDNLVIDSIPDIFHAGHVHTVGIDNYRGTLIVNSGAWQAQTAYQANLGIMPRPGFVPIVNLATLEVTMREFLTS
jgi:DNA polymerase II small subunit